MQIKRSSLICKIAGPRYQDNLCRFFWRLVGHVLCAIFITGATIIIIYGWIINSHAIFILITVLSGAGAVFLPILAIEYLRAKLGKSPELPCENIIFEYLKAKKQKICPLIKYVD